MPYMNRQSGAVPHEVHADLSRYGIQATEGEELHPQESLEDIHVEGCVVIELSVEPVHMEHREVLSPELRAWCEGVADLVLPEVAYG